MAKLRFLQQGHYLPRGILLIVAIKTAKEEPWLPKNVFPAHQCQIVFNLGYSQNSPDPSPGGRA